MDVIIINFEMTSKIIAVTALFGTASAWWSQSHLLISRIAQTVLENESPEVISKVNQELSLLSKQDPARTKAEADHPFVECATFADLESTRNGTW